MALPPEHAALLNRADYPVRPDAELEAAERETLARYGHWLAALAAGSIAPTTPEQMHFVSVAHGEAEPHSAFERAWAKHERSADVSPPVGPLELGDCLERLKAARDTSSALRAELAARRDAILDRVRPQLEELDAEYADRLNIADADAAGLEAAARDAVLSFGASFRHAGVSAVYSRGRVSWDTPGLVRYAESHPELAEFRRMSAPIVSLRFAKEQKGVAE